MISKLNLFLVVVLLLSAGMANSVSAQDCSINTVENVKQIDKAGRSPVYVIWNCEMALEFFLKELSSRREAKDTFNEARVLLQIGEIFYELHDWQKSFDFYSQALPLYRQMKITDGESIALYQLSLVSKYLKNYSQSVQYFEELFLVAQTNDARCWASSILGHIADTYLESGNDARAFEYYDKWLAYDRKQNSEMCEYFALKATGTAYEARGKKAEALEFYRKALELLTRFSLNFRSDYITDETKRLRETVERLEK